ncbi:MAG: alpha-galactosidase [Bifidobacteriaceae bacterium]|jgi:alpha-galactosidase|nr:alpha-galactosidase [Bifidobacteriaceae bacterium]
MPRHNPEIAYLRAAGVSLAVELRSPMPQVIHWGPDLGDLTAAQLDQLGLTAEPAAVNSAPDRARLFGVIPTERDAWAGVPGLAGHVDGHGAAPRPRLVDAQIQPSPNSGGVIVLGFEEPSGGLEIEAELELTEEGLLRFGLSVRRPDPADLAAHATDCLDGTGAADSASRESDGGRGIGHQEAAYELAHLLALMPVPRRATEVADFTGKWARERDLQRRPLVDGIISREVRRGRGGHDSPHLLMAATSGFGFRKGEIWATHLAWSGDQRWLIQQLPEGAGSAGAALGAGELLRPGEIRLAPGQRYQAPDVYFAYSDSGLDQIAERFHSYIRRGPAYPAQPRPLFLNTWEAVYFAHELERLQPLVEAAKQVGVERIVLDDGWFMGRRHDRAGLGDWQVDPAVWPDGLAPLVDLIRSQGMSFGLWFEPEMINPDSQLARQHPEWILGPAGDNLPVARSQWVLNVAQPDAYQYILESISHIVERYRVDFIKWDHNRDLMEAVGRDGPLKDRAAVHAQTSAAWRLIDELRARFPDLEIETCAAGGGRMDLGMVRRTSRIWMTDSNDPLERHAIWRGASLLVPPELLGSHVGAPRSHTSGRVTDLGFRLAGSLLASAGIEWDLTEGETPELEALTAWAAMYKDFRELIRTGRLVHADLEDPAVALDGIVAAGGDRALFIWTRLASSGRAVEGRVQFPGLDPAANYSLTVRQDWGMPRFQELRHAPWFTQALQGPVSLPGAVLARAGLPLPMLAPLQALVIEINRQA